MRRTLAATLAVLATGAALLAAPSTASGTTTSYATELTAATSALAVAEQIRGGRTLGDDPSATLAMRDLWAARPGLQGAAAARADALLSRPTDPDPGPGGGYKVDPERICDEHACVHHVTTTDDAPPSTAWARRTLRAVERARTTYVDDLGYRAPLDDGERGGDGRLDVYLLDLGPGLYGYCAPEQRRAARTATGYCVVDNDFAASDYPSGTPASNLRVTVAHEVFHASQFAYDVREDPWLMEATATWAEERLADGVDDNRQYLPYGQLHHPSLSLDHADRGYGNWIFFEHLSQRFGVDVVRSVWEQAGSLDGDGRRRSLGALRAVLARRGGLPGAYVRFAAASTVPGRTFPEGASYGSPEPAERLRLSARHRRAARSVRIDHLASRTYRLVPDSSLRHGPRLRISVHGPRFGRARLVVRRDDGTVRQLAVRLGRGGRGTATVAFGRASISWVGLTLANASTRMRCGVTPRTPMSCGGRGLDDGARFAFSARVGR